MSPLLHFYKNFTIIGTVLVYTVIRNVEFMKPFTRKAAGLRQEERVMAVTEKLEPGNVFHFFEEICKIPHGSGNVEKISDYLAGFARERGLYCIQDAWKNVIIVKEATAGYEEEPPIILQGHMDMVAVKKPEADIDMAKEGLRLVVDGDDLYAQDTSLGGDDGIAVAYALAILDADYIAHPRLEVILTVDEEVGMDGARELDVSMLKGKRMLNLDSEEEGIILAGCAGGARVDWTVPVTWEEQEGTAYEICVRGLAGGHSGAEIDKERGNANSLMGRLLYGLSGTVQFGLSKLHGGLADNAIPREATAVVVLEKEAAGSGVGDGSAEERFLEKIRKTEAEWKRELQTKDPFIGIQVKRLDNVSLGCIAGEEKDKLLCLLCAAPNGVQAMSADMPGLVETSLNMGIVSLEKERAAIQFSVRSSLESAKKALIRKLESMAYMAGASQSVRGDYPGWAYRKDSPFRDMAVETYRRLYGKEPEIQAIHAGLECGLLMAKMPGLECISIGPDMKDIHTTEEKLSISSTGRVWDYILEILRQKCGC